MKILHDQVLDVLSSRKVWEGRQRLFYIMRRDGLARKNKPFQGAADLHFPLIDGCIEKLKPFYFNQAFGHEKMALFVSLRQQTKGQTDAAAELLDYDLKEESNFDVVLLKAIDVMCERARGIVKTYWDPQKKQIVHESKNPVFIVMADGADDFDDADWFCEIKVLSKAQYRRNKAYVQDADFLTKICGSPATEDTDQAREEKYTREGLTFTKDKNKIIIYEHYTKVDDGWVVREWSPNCPEQPVRPAYKLTYEFQGKKWQPYTSYIMEITDDGWYAPRGIAERLAPFEASLCKMWNEKHDTMSFFNKPLFGSDDDLPPGTANVRFRPGEFLPRGVKPLQMPSPPVSYDEEMNSTRNIAEQSIAAPDAGVAPQTTGDNKTDFATATQVNFQQQLASAGINLKGGIFQIGLGGTLQKHWALMVQFKRNKLTYVMAGEVRTLPEQALHDCYKIKPSGAPDQWNKTQRFQRAVARWQMFKNDPRIDQDNLYRDVLRADDGRLVDELLVTTDERAQNERRDEEEEILLMLQGFPVMPQPGQDHQIRLQTLRDFEELRRATGEPISQLATMQLAKHFQLTQQLLAKENPDAVQSAPKQVGVPESGTPPLQPSPTPNLLGGPQTSQPMEVAA